MIRPLPFVWPWWLIFWGVMVWVYLPEFKIVNRGQKAVKNADSPSSHARHPMTTCAIIFFT